MFRRVTSVWGAFLVAGLLAISAGEARAWGFEVHRFVTARAIDLLPAALRPFFEKHRAFVTEHAIDPDLWRNVGFSEEPPRHFLDLDAYGQPPFAALPRDYNAAVAAFGEATVRKNGTVPWRADELFGLLVKAFEQVRDGTSPWALDNVKLYAAVLAHYVADAHVPFHAVVNYDGQLTNQHGLHARFETELVLRYRDSLSLSPKPMPPVANVRDFVFDALASSFDATGPLFEADRRAIGSGLEYDDAYFDRFMSRARPVLEARLERSMSAVAATIAGAWEKAGRPPVPLDPPRVVRKKRTPSR